jgi:hypothetical protein
MGDTRFLAGAVVVAFGAVGALVAVLAAGLTRPGQERPGLVAGALPLALLPPVLASAYASWKLVGLFAAMAGATEPQAGGARNLLAAFASLWWLQRAAWGAFAASCLVGVALAVWRSGRRSGDATCSARRAFVLLSLPTLALAVASLATRPLVSALRVSTAVVSSDEKDPALQARLDAVLEADGLASRGPGSLARTSRFISRAMMTGVFGGAAAAVVLLGLALPGFILAWRVRFGAGFTAAACAAWLLAAAGAALVATGVVDPLRLP